jgi:MoaA/NifB/PqqE/SkfB family radical SAM enzyme
MDEERDLPQFACAGSRERAVRGIIRLRSIRPNVVGNVTVGRKTVDRIYKLHKCLAAASVPSETELASFQGQWGHTQILVQL